MAQPHVILFERLYFHGAHKHVIGKGEANLNARHDDDFNDEGTKSFIILEGDWEFFKDSNYRNKLGGTLGPDLYDHVGSALGSTAIDQISSLRPVNSKEARPKTK